MPVSVVLLGILGAGVVYALNKESSETEKGTLFEDDLSSDDTVFVPKVREDETVKNLYREENLYRENETVSDTEKNLYSYREPDTVPTPKQTLKRGDRFTCPETGEELQVRAIGGRPSHKNYHA